MTTRGGTVTTVTDLGDRIRDEADIADRPGQCPRLRALADEVDAIRHINPEPCCPGNEQRIDSGWLVEVHNHCTIGCERGYPHQPGCGLVPLVQLSNLDGWPAPPTVAAIHFAPWGATLTACLRAIPRGLDGVSAHRSDATCPDCAEALGITR